MDLVRRLPHGHLVRVPPVADADQQRLAAVYGRTRRRAASSRNIAGQRAVAVAHLRAAIVRAMPLMPTADAHRIFVGVPDFLSATSTGPDVWQLLDDIRNHAESLSSQSAVDEVVEALECLLWTGRSLHREEERATAAMQVVRMLGAIVATGESREHRRANERMGVDLRVRHRCIRHITQTNAPDVSPLACPSPDHVLEEAT